MKTISNRHRLNSHHGITILLTLLLLIGSIPIAQERVASNNAATVDNAELHQAVLDLTNSATVMCVAAHPDDEDGTTLTVLRRKYGVHTVSLFSTYGEGGQNAVGPELYEALGVIRARETQEAARIQGSEPHFLGLKDFGFSKSAEEAFRFWGHDEALRRMVYKIRELRPDVIITNHDTTTGHGHHQATGRLVVEAFDAAADPQRFPEQLGKVSVWQPQRLFVRTRPPGASNTTSAPATDTAEKLVTTDPNEKDPIRGTMFAEQALAALQKHASQGPWPASIAERLRGNPTGKLPLIRYRLAREVTGASALPVEAKTFLDGLPVAVSAPTIDGRNLSEIIDQPDRVLNALIDWRRRTGPGVLRGDDPHRSRLMAERLDHALAVAAGVRVTVSTRDNILVPAKPVTFTVNILNSGARTIKIDKLFFAGLGEKVQLEVAEQLTADSETIQTINRITPPGTPLSVPQSDHLYDGMLFGQRISAQADLEVDGANLVTSGWTDITVAPAIEIKDVSPNPFVFTPNTAIRPLSLKLSLVNNLSEPIDAIVKLQGIEAPPFEVGRATVLTPHEMRQLVLQSNALPSDAQMRGGRSSRGQAILSVKPIPAKAPPFMERKISIVWSDARVKSSLKVGYLPSFDTTLEQSLDALGVLATKLGVEEIQKGGLSLYDTIVIDNRGYYAHPELIAANSKLMKYVEQGGTLIVFYHKDSEWNPNPDRGRPQLAPYPIILNDERVTEETAPISFLQPGHALLNHPNKIRSIDFNGWIQERGLYYPKEWDDHYTELFASNDTGEKSLRGGLLVARYGRGNYIYTSMVWYRQLAAGVPGAYRMLANMISYRSR